MIKYLRNNIGIAGCWGMIPPSLPGFDSTAIYDYNPPKCMELLAQAGYPQGKGLPEITLSTTASYLDLCKYIQQQLGLTGIKVKLDVCPPAALRESIAQGKTEWFRGSWIADYRKRKTIFPFSTHLTVLPKARTTLLSHQKSMTNFMKRLVRKAIQRKERIFIRK